MEGVLTSVAPIRKSKKAMELGESNWRKAGRAEASAVADIMFGWEDRCEACAWII
jgi:hypothetical protein